MLSIVRHSRCVTSIVSAVCLSGCLGRPEPAPRPPAGAQQDTSGLPGVAAEQFVASDTTIRAAVVRSLIDHHAAQPVRIDEQLLPPNLDAKEPMPVADDPVLARVLDLQSAALRLACKSEVDSECPRKHYVLIVQSQAVPGNGFGVVSSDYTYDKQSDGSWKFLGVSFLMAIP